LLDIQGNKNVESLFDPRENPELIQKLRDANSRQRGWSFERLMRDSLASTSGLFGFGGEHPSGSLTKESPGEGGAPFRPRLDPHVSYSPEQSLSYEGLQEVFQEGKQPKGKAAPVFGESFSHEALAAKHGVDEEVIEQVEDAAKQGAYDYFFGENGLRSRGVSQDRVERLALLHFLPSQLVSDFRDAALVAAKRKNIYRVVSDPVISAGEVVGQMGSVISAEDVVGKMEQVVSKERALVQGLLRNDASNDEILSAVPNLRAIYYSTTAPGPDGTEQLVISEDTLRKMIYDLAFDTGPTSRSNWVINQILRDRNPEGLLDEEPMAQDATCNDTNVRTAAYQALGALDGALKVAAFVGDEDLVDDIIDAQDMISEGRVV